MSHQYLLACGASGAFCKGRNWVVFSVTLLSCQRRSGTVRLIRVNYCSQACLVNAPTRDAKLYVACDIYEVYQNTFSGGLVQKTKVHQEALLHHPRVILSTSALNSKCCSCQPQPIRLMGRGGRQASALIMPFPRVMKYNCLKWVGCLSQCLLCSETRFIHCCAYISSST